MERYRTRKHRGLRSLRWLDTWVSRVFFPGFGKSVGVPRSSVAPEDICYILYTSGSTGQPKGFMLPHAAVVNVVREISSITQLESGLRVLLFASYSFDASVTDIFGCLSTGGTLYLARRGDMLRDLNCFLVQ